MSTTIWNRPLLVGFRFSFLYFATYMLTGVPVLSQPFREIVRGVVAMLSRWSGLALEMPSSSGSLGNDFSMAMAALAVAVLGTPLWSWLARNQTEHERLHVWLRWAIRYFVLGTMVIYGAAKVMQFGEAPLSQMLQPIGSLTPMGVLWLFMGTSKGYTLFAGACEMIGGLLMLSPRTTTLGALVCTGVMSNVWLMNIFYDVPVKVLSFHLLLMSLFLLLPDARRLLAFFILNRAVEASREMPLFANAAMARVANVARVLLLIAVLGFTIGLARFSAREMPASPLQGAWLVEKFEMNGVARPALATDAARWNRVVIDRSGVIAIQKMDATLERFGMTMEDGGSPASRLKLSKLGNAKWSAEFQVRPLAGVSSEGLVLTGALDGAEISAWLRKDALPQFPLAAKRQR